MRRFIFPYANRMVCIGGGAGMIISSMYKNVEVKTI